jgi:hypothetical protein
VLAKSIICLFYSRINVKISHTQHLVGCSRFAKTSFKISPGLLLFVQWLTCHRAFLIFLCQYCICPIASTSGSYSAKTSHKRQNMTLYTTKKISNKAPQNSLQILTNFPVFLVFNFPVPCFFPIFKKQGNRET